MLQTIRKVFWVEPGNLGSKLYYLCQYYPAGNVEAISSEIYTDEEIGQIMGGN